MLRLASSGLVNVVIENQFLITKILARHNSSYSSTRAGSLCPWPWQSPLNQQITLSLSTRSARRFTSTTTTVLATTTTPPPPASTDLKSSKPSTKVLSSLTEVEELDPPIQFSTSRASKHKAIDSIFQPLSNSPKHETTVIILSFAVFLLYFCILREENDLDEEMGKTLWERIPGLERKQLDVVLEYNRQVGLPTLDIENRIAELDAKAKSEAAQGQKMNK